MANVLVYNAKKIYVKHRDMVRFLFPSFVEMRQISYVKRSGNILFMLSRGMDEVSALSYLAKNYKAYMVLTESAWGAEVVIDKRDDYIKAAQDVFGLRSNKEVFVSAMRLSDGDFFEFLKLSIALRRWHKEYFEAGEQVYRLFSALSDSQMALIRVYYELRDVYPAEQVWSSVLTFLSRVGQFESQKDMLSDYYKRVVNQARSMQGRVRGALRNFILSSSDISLDLRVINFFMDLRDSA